MSVIITVSSVREDGHDEWTAVEATEPGLELCSSEGRLGEFVAELHSTPVASLPALGPWAPPPRQPNGAPR